MVKNASVSSLALHRKALRKFASLVCVLLATVLLAAAPAVTPASGSARSFGTLAVPCHNGIHGGASDLGITSTTIRLGTGDDAGASSFDDSVTKTMKHFVAWCNQLGGINGRKVLLDFRNGSRGGALGASTLEAIKAACEVDFMLVGSSYLFDGSAESTRLGCNLVSVPATTSLWQSRNSWETYSAVPNPFDVTNITGIAQATETFGQQAVKSACAVTENSVPAFSQRSLGVKGLATSKKGWAFSNCTTDLGYLAYSVKPKILDRAALSIKHSGAKVLTWSGNPEGNFEALLLALHRHHVQVKWFVGESVLSTSFAQWNFRHGGVANSVYAASSVLPFTADSSPAVAVFNQIARSAGQSAMGEHAAAAFLLWATAANECGANLTRQCVVSALGRSSAYSAGGLIAPTNPASNLPPICGVLLHLHGKQWTQVIPKVLGSFQCSPTNRVANTLFLTWLKSTTGATLTDRHLGSSAGDLIAK
jgi:hypothetical protein